MDLAIGVIIGTAFGKVVNSLVNDIIMPPIGLLLKGVNFKNFFFSLDGHHYDTLVAAQKADAATINYGNFITVIIEFLIVSICVFAIIKALNTFARNKIVPLSPSLTKTEKLLTEIRDALKKDS